MYRPSSTGPFPGSGKRAPRPRRKPSMSSLQQFCTFLLDGNTFGVPVPAVQEVIQFQEMTPVPLAPPVVSGMINLRGQIVTAIDLRRRMGLGERSDGQLPLNVIVRT